MGSSFNGFDATEYNGFEGSVFNARGGPTFVGDIYVVGGGFRLYNTDLEEQWSGNPFSGGSVLSMAALAGNTGVAAVLNLGGGNFELAKAGNDGSLEWSGVSLPAQGLIGPDTNGGVIYVSTNQGTSVGWNWRKFDAEGSLVGSSSGSTPTDIHLPSASTNTDLLPVDSHGNAFQLGRVEIEEEVFARALVSWSASGSLRWAVVTEDFDDEHPTGMSGYLGIVPDGNGGAYVCGPAPSGLYRNIMRVTSGGGIVFTAPRDRNDGNLDHYRPVSGASVGGSAYVYGQRAVSPFDHLIMRISSGLGFSEVATVPVAQRVFVRDGEGNLIAGMAAEFGGGFPGGLRKYSRSGSVLAENLDNVPVRMHTYPFG